MSKNFCCVTWKSLSKELQTAKATEIQALISKGLPGSVFAAVIQVLEDMDNHCPVCGYDLLNSQEMVPFTSVQKQVRAPEKPAAPPAQPKQPAPMCPACNGRGNKGADENGIDIICARCLGFGVIDNRNSFVPPTANAERIEENIQMAVKIAAEGKPIPFENTVEGVMGK